MTQREDASRGQRDEDVGSGGGREEVGMTGLSPRTSRTACICCIVARAQWDFKLKKKNKNQLTEEHINKIIDTYRARKDVDKYAHLATLDEIKENDYNLNIPRYVNTFEEEEVTPLPDIAAELNAVQREIDEATTQLVDMLGQLEGTTDEGRSELEAFMKLLKQ